MTETELSASIRGALEANGFWCIRTGVNQRRGKCGTQSGEPGMPDILVMGLGWLEVKTEDGELSDVQRAWHERARRIGVRVEVVRNRQEALVRCLAWRRESGRERAR